MIEEKDMEVNITDLHPTQLYLSEKKLQAIQMLDQSADIINGIQLVFLHLEIASWLQTGITGLIRLYWQVGMEFLLSLIEMVAMSCMLSMRKLARKER